MANSGRFEHVSCDLCGSGRHTAVYHFSLAGDDLNIVECTDCRSTYLTPRPTIAHIADFYESDYYSFGIDPAVNVDSGNVKDALRRTVLKHHFGYTNIDDSRILKIPPFLSALFVNFVAVPHYREKGRLLDIGCGAGQKLLEFKSLGWNVCGVELSDQAAAEGRKVGLDIVTTGMAEMPWPAASFSAITFYHSLEHLPSPRLALHEAFTLLHPGGELLVVVPNFGCWERKLFGRNWNWLDVPIHFHHFTKKTLTKIVADSGFRIETIGFSSTGQSAALPFFNRWPVSRKFADQALRIFGVACALGGSGKALILSARK